MASIRIAMAQFDFPVGDVAGNTERIIEMIGQARDEYGAELVMFPELAVSGYPPEDLLLRGLPVRVRAGDGPHRCRLPRHHRRGRLAAGGWRGGLQRRQRAA